MAKAVVTTLVMCLALGVSASRRPAKEDVAASAPAGPRVPSHPNSVFDNPLGLHFYTSDNVSIVMECIEAMSAAKREELFSSKGRKVVFSCETSGGVARFRSRRSARDASNDTTDVWEPQKTTNDAEEEDHLTHPDQTSRDVRLTRFKYEGTNPGLEDGSLARGTPQKRVARRPEGPPVTSKGFRVGASILVTGKAKEDAREPQKEAAASNRSPSVLPLAVEPKDGGHGGGGGHGGHGGGGGYKAPSHGYSKGPSYHPAPYKGPSYGPYDFLPKGNAKFGKKAKYGDDPVRESQKAKYHSGYDDKPESYFGGFGGGGTVGYGGGGGHGGGYGGGGGHGGGHGGGYGGGGGHGGGYGGGGGHGGGHGGGGYGKTIQHSVQYQDSSYKSPNSGHKHGQSYGNTEYSPTFEYGVPEQSYEAPASSYEVLTPSYDFPKAIAQSYVAPTPSYDAPAPSYVAPAPSYDDPAPSYDDPAPSYDAPAPSYDAPAPSYDTHNSKAYEPPTAIYISPTDHKQPSGGLHITYEVLDDPYNTYNPKDDVTLSKGDSYNTLKSREGIVAQEDSSTSAQPGSATLQRKEDSPQDGAGSAVDKPNLTFNFPSSYPQNLKPKNLKPFANLFSEFDDLFDDTFGASS